MEKVTHLTFDGEGLRDNPFHFDDETRMVEFLQSLSRILGMRILFGPHIEADGLHNPGLTGVVIWSTSHATIHVFDHAKQVRFDAYSCLPYSRCVVEGLLDTYYPCDTGHYQTIERGAVRFPERGINNDQCPMFPR